MRLESGPAKADRNWQIVRAAVFLGFALYFVYDGAIGYPRKNRAEANKLLAGRPFNGQIKFDDLGEHPTKTDFEKLVRQRPTTPAQVYQALGRPTFTDGADEYFISRYGYGKVTVRGGVVKQPLDMGAWKTWKKTKAEIQGQFYWAIIPALPGLYFLWRLYKAVTLHVVIDDEGMTYDKRRILFDQMVSLRDYNPKGWIDLYYKSGETEKKLRLDNEKVLRFDDIVAAICQVKGFRNEVKEYAEKKARQQAAKAQREAEADPSGKDQTDD